jgi:hypothetical protein
MAVTYDPQGLRDLITKVNLLKDLNAASLMESWEHIMQEDNRQGVLDGTNKDGIPMVKPHYRPIAPGPYRVNVRVKGKGVKQINADLKRFRLAQRRGLKRGRFEGFSPFGPGWVERNNNLKTAEYQILGGPPLAPRDQYSRVITNFATDHLRTNTNIWIAWGEWKEVVNVDGFHFLPALFEHQNWDLRGLRPDGKKKAQEALRNWAHLAVREYFGR